MKEMIMTSIVLALGRRQFCFDSLSRNFEQTVMNNFRKQAALAVRERTDTRLIDWTVAADVVLECRVEHQQCGQQNEQTLHHHILIGLKEGNQRRNTPKTEKKGRKQWEDDQAREETKKRFLNYAFEIPRIFVGLTAVASQTGCSLSFWKNLVARAEESMREELGGRPRNKPTNNRK